MLVIEPNLDRKTAKVTGTAAAGEKVFVRVVNEGNAIATTARLRVMHFDRCIAQFPMPKSDDAWDASEDGVLKCVLNLNTVQAERLTRGAAETVVFFVIDDVSPDVMQLHSVRPHPLLSWVRSKDNDVPVNLDAFPSMLDVTVGKIDEFTDRITKEWNDFAKGVRRTLVEGTDGIASKLAALDAEWAAFSNAIRESVSEARRVADNAAGEVEEERTRAKKAEGSISYDVANQKVAIDNEVLRARRAEAALEKKIIESVSSKQEIISDLSEIRRNAQAGSIAPSNKSEIDRIKASLAIKQDAIPDLDTIRKNANAGRIAPQNADEIHRIKDALQKKQSALTPAQLAKIDNALTDASAFDRAGAANDERVRAEGEENKLRAAIAAIKTFKIVSVDALPASGEEKTIYLVPSAKAADRNIKDEFLWIEGKWEQVGSTAVDMTGYAKINDLAKKRDIDDMFTPWVFVGGKALDPQPVKIGDDIYHYEWTDAIGNVWSTADTAERHLLSAEFTINTPEIHDAFFATRRRILDTDDIDPELKTEGRAADAKAVGERMLDKTTGGIVNGDMLVNTDGTELNGVGLKFGDKFFKLVFDEGLLVFITNYNGKTLGVRIPYNRIVDDDIELAITSDIDAATKLTPVWSFEYDEEEHGSHAPFSMRFEYEEWNLIDKYGNVYDHKTASGNETVVDFSTGSDYSRTVIATVDHYTTAKGEELMAGGKDAKAALFAGDDFKQAVEDEVTEQAVGEIEAANDKLVVKDDGGAEQFNSEKAVRYTLVNTASTTLADMAVTKVTLTGALTTIAIPTAPVVVGRVMDFVADVKNTTEAEAVLEFSGLETAYSFVTDESSSVADETKFAAGEHALLLFTQIPDKVVDETTSIPCFLVAKKVVK